MYEFIPKKYPEFFGNMFISNSKSLKRFNFLNLLLEHEPPLYFYNLIQLYYLDFIYEQVL